MTKSKKPKIHKDVKTLMRLFNFKKLSSNHWESAAADTAVYLDIHGNDPTTVAINIVNNLRHAERERIRKHLDTLPGYHLAVKTLLK